MKHPTRTTITALAWLASLALAFWLGRSSHEHSRVNDGAQTLPTTTPSSTTTQLAEAPVHAQPHRGSGRSPTTSLGDIQQITTAQKRQQALATRLQALTVDDLDELRVELRTWPLEDGTHWQDLHDVMRRWGELDAPGAIAFAENFLSGEQQLLLLRAAVAGWTAKDPTAAIAWAKTNSLPNADLIPGAIHGLAPIDPAAATKLALSLPDGNDRSNAIRTISDQLLDEGAPDFAFHWCSDLPDGAFKTSAVGIVAERLANSAPELAAEWLTQLDDGSNSEVAVVGVAGTWSRNDPLEAFAWAASQANASWREPALLAVISKWPYDELPDAIDHAATHANPQTRDRLLEACASRLSRTNPASAERVISLITDETRRQRAKQLMLPHKR